MEILHVVRNFTALYRISTTADRGSFPPVNLQSPPTQRTQRMESSTECCNPIVPPGHVTGGHVAHHRSVREKNGTERKLPRGVVNSVTLADGCVSVE